MSEFLGVLLWGALHWAVAQPADVPQPKDPPAPEGGQLTGPNFLVSVTVGGAGAVQGPMTLALDGGGGDWSVEVKDDGSGHDHTAGDGRFSAEVGGYPGGAMGWVLRDSEGGVLWRIDDFQVPPTMEYPSLRLKFFGGKVSGGLVEDVPVGSAGDGGIASYELPEEAPEARSSWWLLATAALTGLFSAFLLVGIRKGMGSSSVGLLPVTGDVVGGLPAVEPGAQVWRVADPDRQREIALEIARREARHRPVLLVARPDHRADFQAALSGKPGIALPRQDRPLVKDLVDWSRALVVPTHGLLLVEGSLAIEAPGPDEAPVEVLEELMQKVRSNCLVLLGPEEESPVDPAHRLVARG